MGNLPPPTHINIFREAYNYWTSIRLDKNIHLDFPIFFLSFCHHSFIRSFLPIRNSLQQVSTMGRLTSIGEPMSKGINLSHSNVNPPEEAYWMICILSEYTWNWHIKEPLSISWKQVREGRKITEDKAERDDIRGKPLSIRLKQGQAWRKLGQALIIAILMRRKSMMH